MEYTVLTQKELKDQELLELHKTVLTNFLKEKTKFKPADRKLILKRYDQVINRDNIRYYYNRQIRIFTAALVINRLDLVAKYQPKNEKS